MFYLSFRKCIINNNAISCTWLKILYYYQKLICWFILYCTWAKGLEQPNGSIQHTALTCGHLPSPFLVFTVVWFWCYIFWELMGFCAGSGPLQLGVVLVYLFFRCFELIFLVLYWNLTHNLCTISDYHCMNRQLIYD